MKLPAFILFLMCECAVPTQDLIDEAAACGHGVECDVLWEKVRVREAREAQRVRIAPVNDFWR